MTKVDSHLSRWFKTHDTDHTGRLNAEQLQTRVTNFEIEMTVLTRFPWLARLGDFCFFFKPVLWLLGRRKNFLIRKILKRNPSTTSSADVILMSHHRNNVDVKILPQFCKTVIFPGLHNEHKRQNYDLL